MKRQFFVAYDGEGIDGKYVLLSDSHGGSLCDLNGLQTAKIFEWLFERYDSLVSGKLTPVFVGFATTYDFNMMLRDLDDDSLRRIFDPDEKKFVRWTGYEILCFPKKLMRIRRSADSHTITLYDVFTFFGKSFLKTAREFLGDVPELDIIVKGKERRGGFKAKDISFIKKYNILECEMLVRVMDALRTMFEKNSVDLRKWHGPGAVADFLLGRRGFDVHGDYPNYAEDETPQGLAEAWDCAFYGGRIENTLVGSVKNVFCYDINSAYPKAASLLPTLSFARYWKRESNLRPERASPMSCYLVEWNLPECFIGPFPWRDSYGRIFFPRNGIAWVWQPECLAARRIHGKRIRIVDAWTHPAERSTRFSSFVPDLYTKRQRLKDAGDSSEYAVKISLNSLYGKLAQRVGQHPYQCLPFAGWITSWCRAQLLQAAQESPRSVIAFATDSIFSRTRLSLPESSMLGGWKLERYRKVLVLMSGFYKLDDETKRIKTATRGVPTNISWDDIVSQLNANGVVRTKQQTFITHNMAMHFPKAYGPKRLLFTEREKVIDPFSSAKRIYRTKHLDDWSEHHVMSEPVNVSHDISNPSSLTFEPEFQAAMKNENIEDEGNDDENM